MEPVTVLAAPQNVIFTVIQYTMPRSVLGMKIAEGAKAGTAHSVHPAQEQGSDFARIVGALGQRGQSRFSRCGALLILICLPVFAQKKPVTLESLKTARGHAWSGPSA